MTHAGHRLMKPFLRLNARAVSERRRNLYRSPKIIFAKMARECEAFLDVRGEYASVNTNCFHQPRNESDLEYVAAFCNSNIFMFLYNQFFGALRMSGGYYQFQAPQLRVIPLRDAPERAKRRITQIVQRLTPAAVDDRTRNKGIRDINDEFYTIYSLTSDEIATVEEVCR